MTVLQLRNVLANIDGHLDVLMWDTKECDWESIDVIKVLSIPEGVVMGVGLEPTK